MKVLGLTIMALLLVASAGQAQVTIDNPGVSHPWTSSVDASWGSAATRSNPPSGGQSGAYFAMTRASGGSSANVLQVAINSGQTGDISGYLRRVSVDNDHWMEYAYKLGNFTASDFDTGTGWNLIIKFDGFGIANGTGNGNTWTNYTATGVAAGANTQVSIGVKYGSSGASTAEAGWDTLVVASPLEIDNWMLY